MTQRFDFVDISHHQGDVDFDNLAASGCLGVIHKATEGTSYVDDRFFDNRAAAAKVGMPFCTYHFLKHGNVGEQMQHYLDTVAPSEGERMVIDYEDSACTADDLLAAVEFLLAGGDVEVTVYGASKLTDDVNAYKGDLSPLRKTSLWAARYSSNQPVIATKVWPVYTAWQYSDKGTVQGVTGAVDLNTFNGSQTACVEWFGPAGEPAPVPPAPGAYDISMTVPSGTRMLINGQELIAE